MWIRISTHIQWRYTYSDGTKFFFDGRTIPGCEVIYSSYLHGTKGSAIASKEGDCGQPSSLYASQDLTAKMLWESKVKPEEQDPYQNEWNDLVDAIRDDKPYNEVQRGVEASLVSSMGRMAAHTGREVTLRAGAQQRLRNAVAEHRQVHHGFSSATGC